MHFGLLWVAQSWAKGFGPRDLYHQSTGKHPDLSFHSSFHTDDGFGPSPRALSRYHKLLK